MNSLEITLYLKKLISKILARKRNPSSYYSSKLCKLMQRSFESESTQASYIRDLLVYHGDKFKTNQYKIQFTILNP